MAVGGSYGPGAGGASRTYYYGEQQRAQPPAGTVQGWYGQGPGGQRVYYYGQNGAGSQERPALGRAAASNAGAFGSLPASTYNPIRDVELTEGKRGSEQTEAGLLRQKAQAESDYGINKSEIERKMGEALGGIKRSYGILAARQGEQGNATGTLYGGALLQAAARRASNEGGQTHRLGEEEKAELGRAALNEQRLTGEGGSITEGLTNTRANQQGFKEGIEKLKNTEAAEHGFSPQTWSRDPAIRSVQLAALTGKPVQWSRDPRVRARQQAALSGRVA